MVRRIHILFGNVLCGAQIQKARKCNDFLTLHVQMIDCRALKYDVLVPFNCCSILRYKLLLLAGSLLLG